MAAYMTSSELITSIKKRAMIPTSTRTFSDEDYLRFANEELLLGLLPVVLVAHEEFFVKIQDVPLISNQKNYAIPYRAVGNKLRDVYYKDPNGNLFELSRISPEHKQYYQGTVSQSNYQRFYIEDNNICVWPAPGTGATGFLQMSFYMRPNELVLEKRAGTILAINTTLGTITIDSTPTHFATSLTYDLLQTRSPHKIKAYDLTASSVDTSTNVITFASPSDIPNDLEVGDYICQSEECIIPQVPTDLHVILAQRVACRCLESLGDAQGLQTANAKLAEMEQKVFNLIDNRVEGAFQKILNWNSPLRNYKYFRRRRGIF